MYMYMYDIHVQAHCYTCTMYVTTGKYPVQAVAIMHKICCEAEAAMFHRIVFDELRQLTPTPTETTQTTAIASVDAAFAQNAAAIMCLTTTGGSVVELYFVI